MNTQTTTKELLQKAAKELLQKTTKELLGSGLSEKKLADLVPCSQAAINAYSNGKRGTFNPSFAIGNRLIELHEELCGKPPTLISAQPNE